jgi:deoxycytidylate deaminase
MSTLNHFINRFIKKSAARIKEDEAVAIAVKNARMVEIAINDQLAALRANLIEDKYNVERKSEALENAKYPGAKFEDIFTNKDSYVRGIKTAQDALNHATDRQAETEDSIEYFEGLLEEFNKPTFT